MHKIIAFLTDATGELAGRYALLLALLGAAVAGAIVALGGAIVGGIVTLTHS